MSEINDTLKQSEIESLRDSGEVVTDFKAVIRTRKASKLVIPGLGTFERDEPVHTNDEELIEAALAAGGLAVTIDPDQYTPRSRRKAETDAKAKAEAEAKAKADAAKQTSAKP